MVVLVQTWKPADLGVENAADGRGEHALALRQAVVRGFHPVEMHVDEQPAAGAKAAELLFQQQAVGAQINVFPLQHEAFDQHFDLGIDQRLAAADAHDRCAALGHGRQALLDRQPAVHRVGVFANPAAARAGEVAGVQRLEHQDQRKIFSPASFFRSR